MGKRKNEGMKCLRESREAAKLNAYQMSRRLGINQTSYSYLERKAKTARPDIVVRAYNVAAAAGVSLETFWGWYVDDAKTSAAALTPKAREVVEPLE